MNISNKIQHSPSELWRTIRRGGLGVGALTAIGLVLALVSSILLARGLGPNAFGTYSFIVSVLTLVGLPLHSGLPSLLVREVARHDHQESWGRVKTLIQLSTGWVVSAWIALVVVCGCVVLLLPNEHHLEGLLVVGMPLPLLLGLNRVRSALLRGLRHVVSSQLPDSLVQPLVHILVLAGLLHLTGLSPNSALVGLMISVVVACLVGWYLLWKVVHSRWQTRALPFDLRGLFSAWIPFSALAGVLIVNEQVTTVLLGILGTESDVAHLRIAERGAQLVALPLVVVNTVVGPHLARAFHDRAPHLAQLVAVRSAWLALCLAAPLTIVLVVWGDSILDVVYGVEYAEAGYWPLAILTAGQLAVTMFGPVGALLNMAGHERESLRGLVLGLITNVVACYVLIPPWGDVGAAWAIVCSLVVWNLVLSIQLFRRTRVHSSPVAAAIARKGATWWDAESNDERPR